MDQLSRTIHKLTAPLRRRVALMIGRAVLGLVDDAKGIQLVQLTVLGNEVLDRVERFQQYGFTSVPHAEAEAVVLALGGDRAHGIAIAVDDRRYRLKNLPGGEVALYDDQGQTVHLMRDGIRIETDRPNGVAITAPIVTVTADQVEVGATDVAVTATQVTVEADQATFTGGGIDLGGLGGQRVARIGDMVQVTGGSSAGLHPIVEGATNVRAV